MGKKVAVMGKKVAELLPFILMPGVALAVNGVGGMSPACKAAEALGSIWGLVQVVITGVVVLGLLGGAAASFMERRGGWGIGMIFASFILGAILWTALSAIGNQIEQFRQSCGAGI